MSRSYRHTPIVSLTAGPRKSEKDDKRVANRRLRRKVHMEINSNPEQDVLTHLREVSDPWTMSKDGKQFLGRNASRKILIK